MSRKASAAKLIINFAAELFWTGDYLKKIDLKIKKINESNSQKLSC